MRFTPIMALAVGLILDNPTPAQSMLVIPTEQQVDWTVSHLANNLTTLLPIETIKSAAEEDADLVLQLVMAIKGEIFGILQKFPMSLSPSQSMMPVREECFDGELYRVLAVQQGVEKDQGKKTKDETGVEMDPPPGYHGGTPQAPSDEPDEDTDWRYKQRTRRSNLPRRTYSRQNRKRLGPGPYESAICAVCNITRTAGSATDPCFLEEVPPIIDRSNAINDGTDVEHGGGRLRLPLPEMPGLPIGDPRFINMADVGQAPPERPRSTFLEGDDGMKKKHVIVPLKSFSSQGTDLAYFGKVLMGSHRQEVELVFDTGSTDLWVRYILIW